MCCEWDKYKKTPGLFLSIQHVKNTNLPSDVFEAGETKPTRPLKKQPANGTAAANVKKRAAPPDVCNIFRVACKHQHSDEKSATNNASGKRATAETHD